MSLVKNIETETQFTAEISSGKSQSNTDKLIVIDFYADWCGPCKMIAPFMKELSIKYPHVTFLKVNVDKLPDLASTYNVSAMPTFLFLKNGSKVDLLQGANNKRLEDKVVQHGGTTQLKEGDVAVKGQMDLISFIMKDDSECLNESNQNNFLNALEKGATYLESDTDEQLIIYLNFNQVVKIHSLCIDGPDDQGPKKIKLYINQPTPPDFETCLSTAGTQDIELTKEDLKENQVFGLRFVKFQHVNTLTIFVENNLGNTETTRIDFLGLYGRPVATTNMNDLRKISDNKGVHR